MENKLYIVCGTNQNNNIVLYGAFSTREKADDLANRLNSFITELIQEEIRFRKSFSHDLYWSKFLDSLDKYDNNEFIKKYGRYSILGYYAVVNDVEVSSI